MSAFQIADNLGQRVHTTRGRTIRGRWSVVPLWPKRGLVVPNVCTPKIASPVPKGDGLYAFAWKQPKALSPFINNGSGPKHKKTTLNTSALGTHKKREKWRKCHYWSIYTHGRPKPI